MNTNSYLCNFIHQHPTDWEEILINDYEIKIKKEGNYAIFNYSIVSNFNNPIVQEARGIIIDYVDLEVVCWPFRKFGNYNESYADKIDWTTAKVLEKVDGSIIKLWYNKSIDSWRFSTNGSMDAKNAHTDGDVNTNFYDVILLADNYKDIPFEKLDKTNTYIFELVSPMTKVLVNYDTTSLFHIGTRSNITGLECEVDISIKKPQSYKLNSLSDCINAAIQLNKQNTAGATEDISKEGFVVVDANYNRVKIKSPDYIIQHKLVMSNSLTKREYLRIIIENNNERNLICKCKPDFIPIFKYYDYKLEELKHSADKLCQLTKSLYAEYGNDRKAVAKVITKHKLSHVAFRCLTCNESGSEILMQQSLEQLSKLIDDYQPEDLSKLFMQSQQK